MKRWESVALQWTCILVLYVLAVLADLGAFPQVLA